MEQPAPILINGISSSYFISSYGDVISYGQNKKKILKGTSDKKGYLRVRLSMNDNKYSRKIHRLVALAFIPNPDNLPEVNHKDGNKANNHVDNLEWSTGKQNVKHAVDNGLVKRKYGIKHWGRRRIGQYLGCELIKEYELIKEAVKEGYSQGSISRSAITGIKHKGYHWKYLN